MSGAARCLRRDVLRTLAIILAIVALVLTSSALNLVPAWIEVDTKKLEGVLKAYPDRNELSADINENLIVELYSK